MKQKILIIFGITALCTLFGTVGVFAGSNIEQIQVYLNHNITFSVDNTEWTPKEDDGSTLAPIIYNGHTYLPVRAVGQALGAGVVWDDANQKVKITQTVTDATYGKPYKDVNPKNPQHNNNDGNHNNKHDD